MNSKMAARIAVSIVWLAAIAGTAQAQSVAGLGGGAGLGGLWSAAGRPLQGEGFLALNAGIVYLNNVLLTPTNKRSDELATIGFDVNYKHSQSLLNVTAFGNLNWLQYVHHSFSPQLYGNLSTDGTWGSPNNLFQFDLRDTFGESQQNPLIAPTVANQEYINYLSTGPTLNFNFSTRARLNVHGRYASTTYQRSPYNSWSYDGGTEFTYGLSPISSLSLDVEALRTRYSVAGIAPTYDTRMVYLSYKAKSQLTSITFSGGYTQNNYTGSWTGEPAFSLDLTRQLGPFASVYLSGETGYYTLGESMTTNLATPTGASAVAGALPYTSSPAPYKEYSGSFGWHFDRLRTSIGLAATIGEVQYQQASGFSTVIRPVIAAAINANPAMDPSTTLNAVPDLWRFIRPFNILSLDQSTSINNTFESYSASLTRKLQPTLSLNLQGYFTNVRYGQLSSSSIRESYILRLTKQFGQAAISAYGGWSHQNTSGTNTGFAFARYDAAVAGLTFTYNLISPPPP